MEKVQVAPSGNDMGHKEVAEEVAREQLLTKIDVLAERVGSSLNAARVALFTKGDLQQLAFGLEKWAND